MELWETRGETREEGAKIQEETICADLKGLIT